MTGVANFGYRLPFAERIQLERVGNFFNRVSAVGGAGVCAWLVAQVVIDKATTCADNYRYFTVPRMRKGLLPNRAPRREGPSVMPSRKNLESLRP